MSIEAMNWALNVPIGGNAKIVLLGLANHAHPDGSDAYPSLDTLAVYACCDRATARRNVRKLTDLGWAVLDGEGPKGQNRYRLPLEQPTDPLKPWPLLGIVEPPLRVCVYCGGVAHLLDHLVPKNKGGEDAPRNRVPACGPCNESKGAKDAETWAVADGRDWPEITARINRWQNATLASEARGGGKSGVAGVAAAPPEPSSEPPKNREEEARERESRIPDGFPDELRPHARAVLPILRAVAKDHNAKEIKPLALGRMMMGRPHKPFVKSAHDFAAWAVDPSRPIRDVIASYRTWLDRAPDLAGPERLPGEPGPAGSPAPRPAGGPPGSRDARRAEADQRAEADLEAIRRLTEGE